MNAKQLALLAVMLTTAVDFSQLLCVKTSRCNGKQPPRSASGLEWASADAQLHAVVYMFNKKPTVLLRIQALTWHEQ